MALGAPLAAQRGEERTYAIPSSRLETALTALGTQAGIDLLFERDVVDGRRSAAVSGTMSREQAVATLLGGTGLAFRFTGPRAALIALPDHFGSAGAGDRAAAPARMTLDPIRVRAATLIGGSRAAAGFDPYGRRLQGEIDRRLRADTTMRGHDFRAEIAIRLDTGGRIETVALTRSSGDSGVDRAIRLTLIGLRVPELPPPGMPQPVRFAVMAD